MTRKCNYTRSTGLRAFTAGVQQITVFFVITPRMVTSVIQRLEKKRSHPEDAETRFFETSDQA
jgi:hypothetical protein